MSARNRQMVLLTVLMVAFVGLLVRQFGPQLGGGPVSRPGRPQSSGPAGVVPDAAELAELRLEALEHKPAVYQPGRDPFRFGPAPKKPPAPKPEPPPKAPAPRRERPRPATPPAPPAPQPPPVEFVFLGSFGVSGREIAVFSDGKEILNAFAGDVLQKEFVVRSIGFESADIGFVNFPEAPAKRLAVGG